MTGDRLALYFDLFTSWLRLKLYATTYDKPHPGFNDMPEWGTQ